MCARLASVNLARSASAYTFVATRARVAPVAVIGCRNRERGAGVVAILFDREDVNQKHTENDKEKERGQGSDIEEEVI